MKKILQTFYYLVIALIAVIALFLMFSIIPIKGGYKTLVVLSGSMEPAIHTGSVVVIKPVENYQVGDIITFGAISKTKPPTTHRIVEIKETDGVKTYLTKGDNNNAPDIKAVAKKEILGKVLFSVPYFGYAVAATQKPAGFVLIVVVPAVFVVYDEVQKIRRELALKKKLALDEDIDED
jgi:signal peptidase